MKKAAFAIVELSLLLSSVVPACADLAQVHDFPQNETERIIADYLDFMIVCEKRTSTKCAAYDIGLEFCEEPNWARLQKTRLALHTAGRELARYSSPGYADRAQKLVEEIRFLAPMEFIEPAVISQTVYIDNTNVQAEWDSLIADWNMAFYTENRLSWLKQEVEVFKLGMEIEASVNMTYLNALLLMLPDTGQALYEEALSFFPHASTYAKTWLDTPQAAGERVAQLLSAYPADDLSFLLTKFQAIAYDRTGGTNEDTTLFFEDAPLLIPFPSDDAFKRAEFRYLTAENTRISSMADMDQASGELYVQWSADPDQFDAYIALLASMRIEPLKITEESEKKTLLYHGYSEKPFMLFYDDGLAGVLFTENSADFAPLTYCAQCIQQKLKIHQGGKTP